MNINNLMQTAIKEDLFNPLWYQQQHKLSFKNNLEAFEDYVKKSKYSDISPSQLFDSVRYFEHNWDIYHAYESPLVHYILHGQYENRYKFPLRKLWNPRNEIKTNQNIRKGKFAIVLHIFYEDFIERFNDALTNTDFEFDLFITTTNEKVPSLAEEKFRLNNKIKKIAIKTVPNRGRNFGPFLVEFNKELLEYDFFCHLHSKKSLYSGKEQIQWSNYLIEYIIKDKQILNKTLSIFESTSEYGIYYPTTYWAMPSSVNHWLKNKREGIQYINDQLNITETDDFISYPVGGMFWARVDALKPLLEKEWTYENFPSEPLPADGTFLHVLERVLPKIAQSQGYKEFFYYPPTGQFTDDNSFIFQKYYHDHKSAFIHNILNHDIISLDVFDTLVKRDYFEPDFAKYKLPLSLDLEIEPLEFVKLRNRAEFLLRKEMNFQGDIDIYSIYERFTKDIDIKASAVDLANKEFEIDLEMLQPKEVIVDLVNSLHHHRKQIFIVTDTYYTEKQIRLLLSKIGLKCNYRLFVSSALGLRKDSGTMWKHINDLLVRANTKSKFIHIGDNVASDIQTPGDLGLMTFHILNPIDKWQSLNLPNIKNLLSFEKPESILKWGPLISHVGSNPFLS